MAVHTYPVIIKDVCFREFVTMCVRAAVLCKQRGREGGRRGEREGERDGKREVKKERMLAVLVVINHLVPQYPLTWALFDLDRSKMVVLK